jgi:hypothetical protein
VHSVEQSSALGRAAADVWARAVTEKGINDELRPLLRMTMPRGLRGKTIDAIEAGEPLGWSLILLGGLLPVDYDDLCLAELGPGRRFLERSRTLAFTVWQHDWFPGMAWLARTIVGALFRHRHRRLRRHHGVAGVEPQAAGQSS